MVVMTVAKYWVEPPCWEVVHDTRLIIRTPRFESNNLQDGDLHR